MESERERERRREREWVACERWMIFQRFFTNESFRLIDAWHALLHPRYLVSLFSYFFRRCTLRGLPLCVTKKLVSPVVSLHRCIFCSLAPFIRASKKNCTTLDWKKKPIILALPKFVFAPTFCNSFHSNNDDSFHWKLFGQNRKIVRVFRKKFHILKRSYLKPEVFHSLVRKAFHVLALWPGHHSPCI